MEDDNALDIIRWLFKESTKVGFWKLDEKDLTLICRILVISHFIGRFKRNSHIRTQGRPGRMGSNDVFLINQK